MTASDEIIANDILRTVDEGLKQRPFYKDTREVEEEQTTKGIAKYPNTVNPKDYSLSGWLRHRQQEDYDGLVYTTCALKIAEEIESANQKLISALRFYAQQGNWAFRDDERMYSPSEVEKDKGHLARKTLEGLGYGFN